VTPVAGTITLTDVDIELSGEQRNGSTKPIARSFYDALALYPNKIWRDNFVNGTWGSRDFRVVWQPFWKVDYESELVFADLRERDRFFVDLTSAIQDWATKYPQFAAKGLEVYQLCGEPGGHFSPCSEATPVAVNATSQQLSIATSSRDNPVTNPTAAAGSDPSLISNMPDRSLAGLLRDIEAGKEISIHARYNQAVPGCVYMDDITVRLSKSTFSIENAGPFDFQVSPDKILNFENQSGEASRLHLKVAILNKKGNKETAKDYYLYNAGASAVGSAPGCQGSSVSCNGCDDSMNILYALLTRIRGGQ
jgi:hypothetical protein